MQTRFGLAFAAALLLAAGAAEAQTIKGQTPSPGVVKPVQVDANGYLILSPTSETEVEGDVAHDAADAGNPVKIGGKGSASAPAAVTDGDRVNAYFDRNGRLVILMDQPIPAGTNTIGGVAGDTANDAADAGNPLKIGGKANASAPSDVTDGDRVNAYFDRKGRLAVFLDSASAVPATTLTAITCTDTSNDSVGNSSETVFSANASRKSFCISNNDASVAIHVRLGATATTTNSVRVPAGQSICYDSHDGYMYQGVIDAVAASGTVDISGFECQ